MGSRLSTYQRPSVVLLDLNLPDSQGAETFRKVLEKAPGVPVVILSGQDDVGLAMKALAPGRARLPVEEHPHQRWTGPGDALRRGTAGAPAFPRDEPEAATGVQEPVPVPCFARTAHAAHLHPSICDHPARRPGRRGQRGTARPPQDHSEECEPTGGDGARPAGGQPGGVGKDSR